jgi:hypothetical protein
LDVEGLPDRDFYYLIGVRVRGGESVRQHSLWANDLTEEKKIAIACRQQKCLVHLIRDLNEDLWKNPFNIEYEQFVASVRDVLMPIFEDIERYGLKARHLRKHNRLVEDFYRDTVDVLPDRHDVLSKYKKRFERYRNSMFTFLGDDQIPWNNNAAERALRHLAV